MNNQDKIDFRSHLEFELCTLHIFCKTIFFFGTSIIFYGTEGVLWKISCYGNFMCFQPVACSYGKKDVSAGNCIIALLFLFINNTLLAEFPYFVDFKTSMQLS